MAPKNACAKYQYVVTPNGPKIVPVNPITLPKDEESPADYNSGGYLHVKLRDSFKDGRYVVIRKLGWGHFSTVWLVNDTQTSRHSALKVVKSASRYAETARDEIKLLRAVQEANPSHPGHKHVVSLLDSFHHCAPEDIHVCLVFEPLGENLLALIERNNKTGIPVALVKIITKQVLLGLQYLHEECDLVHTDIKPENIMIAIPDIEQHIQHELSVSPSPTARKVGVPPKPRAGVAIPRRTGGREKHVHIFDSQPLSSPFTSPITSASSSPTQKSTLHMTQVTIESKGTGKSQTLANSSTGPSGISLLSQMAPQNAASTETVKLEESSNQGPPPIDTNPTSPPPISIKIADLGNATPSKRHFTEDIQTRQYRSPEAILGRSDWTHTADVWSVACVVFELLTAEYLFDPQAQANLFSKDDDHMALIIELLGGFDMELKMGGRYSRELFDSKGQLRHIRNLKPWPLERVMVEKYMWNVEASKAFCEFLLPMLELDWRKRAQAKDLVDHPWLNVEGELFDFTW
ncbi:kinase-like protein [Thelephora ganbajun]|uniref:Kinase-like protein n=1 Tax=Thelephora ganbajun TaxID=370292 RepID=A0ACB6ZG10_THEGA|nr:kinase-like protein [Thelephora ganbajun]